MRREEAEKVFLGAAETGSTSALVAEQGRFSWEQQQLATEHFN